MKKLAIAIIGLSFLTACDGMTRQQQPALSGGGAGAAIGALSK